MRRNESMKRDSKWIKYKGEDRIFKEEEVGEENEEGEGSKDSNNRPRTENEGIETPKKAKRGMRKEGSPLTSPLQPETFKEVY